MIIVINNVSYVRYYNNKRHAYIDALHGGVTQVFKPMP